MTDPLYLNPPMWHGRTRENPHDTRCTLWLGARRCRWADGHDPATHPHAVDETERPPDADVADMRRAIRFCTLLLREELGAGGLMEDADEHARTTWAEAIGSLEAAAKVPMIPLYTWRHLGERGVPTDV